MNDSITENTHGIPIDNVVFSNGREDVKNGSILLTEPIKCLDHGFVRYVDHMGDDVAIVQAARVSYGKGTKSTSEDQGLISYLMRHQHWTPFEMCEIKLHCKMPIFIARQWVRHRCANINEYSARYSEIKDEFYCPGKEQVQPQSTTNKQGRGENLDFAEVAQDFIEVTQNTAKTAASNYRVYAEHNMAREINRINIPLTNYTEWYWKCDLRNIFGFLKLRLDSHAQYEIRVFADAMAQIVKALYPAAWKAFEIYELYAVKFSEREMDLLRKAFFHRNIGFFDGKQPENFNNREWEEFLKKIDHP